MFIVLVLVVIGAVLSYDQFLTVTNLQNLLGQSTSVGIVGIGMTIVLISGGFDLSASSIFAAGSVTAAAVASTGQPLVVAAIAAVAVGCLCGLFNGLLITRLKVNAFIATLGSAAVIAGVVFYLSDARAIRPDDPGFGFFGEAGPLGLDWAVWMMILLFIIGGFVLAKTTFGRSVYAIGGNPEASRLAGLPVNRISLTAFIVVGACAAMSGLVLASKLGVGQGSQGVNVTLDAIAVVVIGGTSLFGGEGAMWRTAVGVLILATINNVLSSLAAQSSVQEIVKGLVVIGAVALDALSRRIRSS